MQGYSILALYHLSKSRELDLCHSGDDIHRLFIYAGAFEIDTTNNKVLSQYFVSVCVFCIFIVSIHGQRPSIRAFDNIIYHSNVGGGYLASPFLF